MEFSAYFYMWIGSIITLYLQAICYKALSNNKEKYNYKKYLIILFTSIIQVINVYHNYSYYKLLVSFAIITFNCYFIFKETKGMLLIKSMVVYFAVVLSEIILSLLVALSPITNLVDFDTNILIKISFSIITMSLAICICKLKFLQKTSAIAVSKMKEKIVDVLYLTVSLLLVTFLAYNFIKAFDITSYILNISILLCFGIITFIAIKNLIKVRKVKNQQDTLLNFMTKYEKTIDADRINRHEMLNNLLILKSYKNKNSTGYNELLDELISIYDNKGDSFQNIYNLPSGLKGILYYKTNDMKALGIKVDVRIDRKAGIHLNKIDIKEFKNICKVLAILLDNAKEAASLASTKEVLVDFQLINSCLKLEITNTFKGNANLDKISMINYSTKGKGRGLGLYIANNIINSTDYLSLEQSIIGDIYFNSILSVTKIKK